MNSKNKKQKQNHKNNFSRIETKDWNYKIKKQSAYN